jgi:hypothetical protein
MTVFRAWTGHLFHPPCLPQPAKDSIDQHAPSRATDQAAAATADAAVVEQRLQRIVSWQVSSAQQQTVVQSQLTPPRVVLS